MRALLMVAVGAAGLALGCSNDVDPRVIAGGGVGDGEIDGEVNVYVINSRTEEPIAGAKVAIGETEKTTDAKGLVVFSDVEGAQTIAVLADGYRSGVWVDVNGANVTMPLQPRKSTPDQATMSGTIAGWSNITVPSGHYKLGIVTYSQTDDLGDPANSIMTPNNANGCVGANECAWTVNTRTGTVTLIAIILDVDAHGTLEPSDDTRSVIGYAYKSGIIVAAGVNQQGHALDLIEAGNLETVTLDTGTPPPGLPELISIPGIEISDDEILQLPLFILLPKDTTSFLVPKRTAFGPDATYRLTAIAQTTSGGAGAQSVLLRQGLTDPNLVAGTWLIPPVNISGTRTTISFDPVTTARAHSAVWRDETGDDLLEITVFDAKTGSLEVPNLVALPSSGTVTARVNAFGADFDVNDFSLEEDSDLLWGIAAQPTDIP
jgi:hypothetical protein